MSSTLNTSSTSRSSTSYKSLFGRCDANPSLSAPTRFISSRSKHNSSQSTSRKVARHRQSAVATRNRLKENFALKGMLDSQTDSQTWLANLMPIDDNDVESDLLPMAPLFRGDALGQQDSNQDCKHIPANRTNPTYTPSAASNKIQCDPEELSTSGPVLEDPASILDAAGSAGFAPDELVALLRVCCLDLIGERDQSRGECDGLRIERDGLLEENRRLREVCQEIGQFVRKQLDTI